MAIDTNGMRQVMDLAAGDRMAMDKQHLHALIDATPGTVMAIEKRQVRTMLDAIDLGRVADQLAGISEIVRGMAIAA
ncbi:hypothetical protein GCM10011380_08690 [Sphingomonas metalli]|uniref:Uncharacterized protein n=1 Tax=Sphingomonas metalli TaxID=1779358 RepID=A0A916WQN4_9SPHN|nr:hypothetical protein [Sphingomonas metalli]GGB21388.1 hypothetical protein GCM10011380_08690 [Sphingomonas metalli]